MRLAALCHQIWDFGFRDRHHDATNLYSTFTRDLENLVAVNNRILELTSHDDLRHDAIHSLSCQGLELLRANEPNLQEMDSDQRLDSCPDLPFDNPVQLFVVDLRKPCLHPSKVKWGYVRRFYTHSPHDLVQFQSRLTGYRLDSCPNLIQGNSRKGTADRFSSRTLPTVCRALLSGSIPLWRNKLVEPLIRQTAKSPTPSPSRAAPMTSVSGVGNEGLPPAISPSASYAETVASMAATWLICRKHPFTRRSDLNRLCDHCGAADTSRYRTRKCHQCQTDIRDTRTLSDSETSYPRWIWKGLDDLDAETLDFSSLNPPSPLCFQSAKDDGWREDVRRISVGISFSFLLTDVFAGFLEWSRRQPCAEPSWFQQAMTVSV